jgi:DNA polymerase
MFIGEAPGEKEDQQGLPFVGPAGLLLNNIIEACKWKREEVYICNMIKCRPFKNRNPAKEELDNCFQYLTKQVSLVNPKFVVLLGSTATNYLLGINVGAARGRWHTCFDKPAIATYHPAYVIRQEGAELVKKKKEVWQDIKLVLQIGK